MKTVYLAGPITGLDYAGATDWRNEAKLQLAEAGIMGLSPMRGKEYLSGVKKFTMGGDKYRPLGVMSSHQDTMTRDRWDATRCDAMLVNLLDAKRVFIGTCMEIAWADAVRTPIVCIMESEGNPHEHGMILEAIGFLVPNLNEALHIIKAMLR